MYCTERRIRRDEWHFGGNVSTNEQHGATTRMPVAMVYCISGRRILVLHGRMVVPKINELLLSIILCGAPFYSRVEEVNLTSVY